MSLFMRPNIVYTAAAGLTSAEVQRPHEKVFSPFFKVNFHSRFQYNLAKLPLAQG